MATPNRSPAGVWRRAAATLRAWAPSIREGADIALGWLPVTPFGLLAAGMLYAAVRRNSAGEVDLIVKSVGVGGLAICVLDVLTVLATGLWLRFTLPTGSSGETLELETLAPARTGFRLGLLSWAPLVHFDVSWRRPPGIDAELRDVGLGRSEEIRPRERALAVGFVRRITVRDWFGLARVRFQKTVNRPVRCLPSCGLAHRYELIEQFKPGDVMGHPNGVPVGDFVEMRRYVSGDPLKLVLWRTFARSQKLMVRKPELSVAPTERMLAYLVSAPGDDPAAGIARSALESQALGPDVVFMADGARDPARGTPEAIDQIVRSIDHRDWGGADLDRFLSRGEGEGTSACFLFASPQPGPWLERVCACVQSHPGPFRAIIGVDSLSADSNVRRWSRWLLEPSSDQPASPVLLRQVQDRLKNAGAEVVVLNRRTGEATSLEELKRR
ncbi:MAG: DUF58 domain-containing protein [Isosphaeraceae bacterium]